MVFELIRKQTTSNIDRSLNMKNDNNNNNNTHIIRYLAGIMEKTLFDKNSSMSLIAEPNRFSHQ
ncbi:hypothetical protein DERF_008491 [Dermatophagoides farinae]|uniref:Uncharacterized protein n=1 Tax=Dermatophagoides farinae TaxID=6954 RepID=A0A922L4D4_DERFA|nr:hypothetical protein DERF_008491 [Dermatophagoides farinae]